MKSQPSPDSHDVDVLEPIGSSPYRAPVHSELAVIPKDPPVVSKVEPAMGSIARACAAVFLGQGGLVGALWLYEVRSGRPLLSAQWAALLSLFAALWWVVRSVRTLRAHGLRAARRAMIVELFALSSGLALIEAFPWSSRWWIELWGTALIVVVAIIALLGLVVRTQAAPVARERGDQESTTIRVAIAPADDPHRNSEESRESVERRADQQAAV
jgi:hypothetical protein